MITRDVCDKVKSIRISRATAALANTSIPIRIDLPAMDAEFCPECGRKLGENENGQPSKIDQ